jgi:hypothetical protein
MFRYDLHAFVIFGAIFVTLAGCASQSLSSSSQERRLTAERAKVALLDMMRSELAAHLGWFDGDVADKMSKMTVEPQQDGCYRWGAFNFNTSKLLYTFVVEPRREGSACVLEYKGAFERNDGRWVATPPELVTTIHP